MRCPTCKSELKSGRRFCTKCGAQVPNICPACDFENAPDDAFCGNCGANIRLAQTGTGTPHSARTSLPRKEARATSPPSPSSPTASEGDDEEVSILQREITQLRQRLESVTPVASAREEQRRTQEILERQVTELRKYIPAGMAEKILKSRGQIEGERKNVTVVFADVSGFTPLSEDLDPEEVTHLMNSCFKTLVDEIYRHEGTVDKFIGDCIMALFGAPIAHENDPERAVRTALAMMKALQKFNETIEKPLAIRIGINSGIVVAGTVGSDLRLEYTVMGDTVNLAQRLESVAHPGKILVSASTYRLTRRFFDYKTLDPIRVKGKRDPVSVYEVIAEKMEPETEVLEHGLGQPPLIGRESEIDWIRGVLRKAQTAQGQSLSIVGEVGVGKTRFTSEMKSLPEAKAFSWYAAKCLPYSQQAAYGIFVHLMKDIRASSQPHSGRKIQESALADEATWLRGLLKNEIDAQLLGSLLHPDFPRDKLEQMNAQQKRQGIFIAAKTLLLTLARRRPLALVFDDMNLVDPASKELLAFLVDAVAEAPVLICCVYRPGFEPEWRSRRYHSEVHLKPFTPDVGTGFLAALLGTQDIAEELREFIISRSQGTPLYILEMVRSLIDAGALVREDDQWVLKGPIPRDQIPETIHGIIAARIDRLESDTKHILQLGAVIGTDFPVRLLDRVAEMGSELDFHLRELEMRGLIERKTGALEPEYTFAQVLTQHVAYESVLMSSRKQFHARLGQAIEEVYPDRLDQFLDSLAHHYYEARDTEKALAYMKKAGDKNRDALLNARAIDYYTRICNTILSAADLRARHALLLIDALKKRGDVLMKSGEYDRAIADFVSALDAARERDAQKDEIDSLLCIGAANTYKGDHKEAMLYCQQVLEMSRTSGYDRGLAVSLNNIGLLRWNDGDYDKAIECHEESLQIRRKMNDKNGVADSLNNLGNAYLHKHEHEKALDCYRESLQIRREIGDRLGIATSLDNIGVHYERRMEADEALKHFEESLAIRREIGDKNGMAASLNNIGTLCCDLALYQAALERYVEGLTIAENIGSRYMEAFNTMGMGSVYLSLGQYQNASEYYNRSLEIARGIGNKAIEAESLSGLGESHLKLKQYIPAATAFENAAALATETGDTAMLAETHYGLARTALGNGQPSHATNYSRSAMETASKLDIKPLLAKLHLLESDLALANTPTGDDASDIRNAKAHAEQAAKISESLHLPEIQWRAHHRLGRLALVHSDHEKARWHFDRTRQIIKQIEFTLTDPSLRSVYQNHPEVRHAQALSSRNSDRPRTPPDQSRRPGPP